MQQIRSSSSEHVAPGDFDCALRDCALRSAIAEDAELHIQLGELLTRGVSFALRVPHGRSEPVVTGLRHEDAPLLSFAPVGVVGS